MQLSVRNAARKATAMSSEITNFYNVAHAMILELRNEARKDTHHWKKDAIMSPIGNLVVVEFISGVNEAYKIDGCAPICTHWSNTNPLNDIMRAAGYVRG